MSAEFTQYFLMGMPAPGNVTVPAHQPGMGKGIARFLLQLLGTGAQELEAAAQAAWAGVGNRYPVVTLVADQNVIREVIGKRDITAPAAKDEAATENPSPKHKSMQLYIKANDLLLISLTGSQVFRPLKD